MINIRYIMEYIFILYLFEVINVDTIGLKLGSNLKLHSFRDVGSTMLAGRNTSLFR